jgi:PBP1b-binding outer membrane lipoprotein LpoB
MFGLFRAPASVLLGAVLLAGCAGDGALLNGMTTASVPDTPRVDPACVTLTTQIEGLRKDGIAEKIEKAAAKKYKMTAADLTKADQLTKANAEYQSRCGLKTPAPTTAAAAPATETAAPATVASTTPSPAAAALTRPADGS